MQRDAIFEDDDLTRWGGGRRERERKERERKKEERARE
jgi:hypothetical protein